MRVSNITMLVAALICASAAALLSRAWLAGQSGGQRALTATQEHAAQPKRSIVVAARELKYGDKLQPDMLRLLPWPGETVPKGAFLTLELLTQPNQDRLVLAPMSEGEPVLEQKVSGAAQGIMAAKIAESMNAVTIRVNDVAGVAGFVQPEDRVDVFMTVGGVRSDIGPASKASVVVLLQNIRVLATDQATQRNIKAAPPKAVTLEVNTEDAQKLVLAGSIGQLSLALRRSNNGVGGETKPIAMDDLLTNQNPVTGGQSGGGHPGGHVVGVTRSVERKEYMVKPDPGKSRAGSSPTFSSSGSSAGGSWAPIN